MALEPKKFVALAKKLLSGKFAKFRKDAVFEKAQAFDYDSQSSNPLKQTVKMIRLDYDRYDQGAGGVSSGDFMLIGEYAHFNWRPTTDSTTVDFDGETLNIKNIDIDPADAVITLQVRLA